MFSVLRPHPCLLLVDQSLQSVPVLKLGLVALSTVAQAAHHLRGFRLVLRQKIILQKLVARAVN